MNEALSVLSLLRDKALFSYFCLLLSEHAKLQKSTLVSFFLKGSVISSQLLHIGFNRTTFSGGLIYVQCSVCSSSRAVHVGMSQSKRQRLEEHSTGRSLITRSCLWDQFNSQFLSLYMGFADSQRNIGYRQPSPLTVTMLLITAASSLFCILFWGYWIQREAASLQFTSKCHPPHNVLYSLTSVVQEAAGSPRSSNFVLKNE